MRNNHEVKGRKALPYFQLNQCSNYSNENNMKNYDIEVTEINYYKKLLTIKADSEGNAKEIAKQMVSEDPLDNQWDTYLTTEVEIKIIPKPLEVHTVESLFDIDREECNEEVILIDDLTDDQKRYLGLL